jgi:hypothetical protein
MVSREVMYTLDPATLFRQDSIATKVLSAYAKEVGMVYLQVTPQPRASPACWCLFGVSTPSRGGSGLLARPHAAIVQSRQLPSRSSRGRPHAQLTHRHQRRAPLWRRWSRSHHRACAQIDPLKLAEGANAEANADNLQVVVTDFLQSIYAQTVNCPPCASSPLSSLLSALLTWSRALCRGFREVAGCLQEEVGSKFSASKTQAVAGFLFLRFLCPAILNPKGYGIMEGTQHACITVRPQSLSCSPLRSLHARTHRDASSSRVPSSDLGVEAHPTTGQRCPAWQTGLHAGEPLVPSPFVHRYASVQSL